MRKMSLYELQVEAKKAGKTPLEFFTTCMTQDAIVLLNRLNAPFLVAETQNGAITEEMLTYHDEVKKLLMEILYLGGVSRK